MVEKKPIERTNTDGSRDFGMEIRSTYRTYDPDGLMEKDCEEISTLYISDLVQRMSELGRKKVECMEMIKRAEEVMKSLSEKEREIIKMHELKDDNQ